MVSMWTLADNVLFIILTKAWVYSLEAPEILDYVVYPVLFSFHFLSYLARNTCIAFAQYICTGHLIVWAFFSPLEGHIL